MKQLKLTEQTIKNLVSDAYFSRGKKYFEQGRVVDFSEDDQQIFARVAGTKSYEVTVSLRDLAAHCDCYAFSPSKCCKHIVAVLLKKMETEQTDNSGLSQHDHASNPVKTSTQTRSNLSTDGKSHQSSSQHANYIQTDFSHIFSMIKQKGAYLNRDHSYWHYVNLQQEFHSYTLDSLGQLFPSNEAITQVKKVVIWLDKQLLRLDDSDGVLQNLIMQCIELVNRWADEVNNQEYIWDWLARKYEFDVSEYLVEDVLQRSQRQNFIGQLEQELLKTTTEKSSKIPLSREVASKLLAEYYYKRKQESFLEFTLREYTEQDSIGLLLANWFIRQNKPTRVVELFWDKRSHYQFQSVIEQALKQAKNYQQLLTLYEDMLSQSFTRELLSKLEQTHQKVYQTKNQPQLWQKLLANIESQTSLYDLYDFYMFLGEYNKAASALINEYECNYIVNREKIEEAVKKFLILDKSSAVKLLKYLFDQEFNKMKTSNYYHRLMEYAQQLLDLGQVSHLRHAKQVVEATYPGKKKLLQLIRALLLD